jgi:hypothetical protein
VRVPAEERQDDEAGEHDLHWPLAV